MYAKPAVLFVYFSFTGQTRRVADAMTRTFEEHGWDVVHAPLQLTDSRYPLPFPWPRPLAYLLGWIPPQVLRRKCLFSLSADIFERPFDLVCVGSPTWWLQPAIPVTSLLRSESGLRLLYGRPFCVFAVARSFWRLNSWRVAALGKRCGGRHVGSRGFVFPGNQLQSFAALAGYLATGESPTRFWGMRVHPYGLTAAAVEAARAFASDLAEGSQDRPR